MSKDYLSLKNPGLLTGVLLLGTWLLCWLVLMGFLRTDQLAGLPLITWSQIILGILAVVLSAVLILPLDKWERH